MSTSLLYHGFGVRGCFYRRTRYEGGKIIFELEQNPWGLRCPCCDSSDVVCRGQTVRRWRTLPIGGKPVFIVLAIQRIACRACNVVRQTRVDFAEWRRSYTRAFERYVLDLARRMTIADVAKHLGVGWDMVKDIQKRYLKRRFTRPRLRDLKQIAIDEISIAKGHRYLTVVLDLLAGTVVFVGDGKGADALDPFWRRLRQSGAVIEAVAIDMSQAYISAVLENLPEATLVFDHFHVVKLFNNKLSDLRRAVQREAEGPLEKEVLKGTRWLLLKNPENLADDRDEKERLEEALKLNQPLATAYYLKEDLRQIWDQPDKKTAKVLLLDWINRAQVSGITVLKKFAKTLATYRRGILSYYDFPISTGPLEGTNNKIRTLQRRAYGFRDQEFFKLRIYALHETKYALVG